MCAAVTNVFKKNSILLIKKQNKQEKEKLMSKFKWDATWILRLCILTFSINGPCLYTEYNYMLYGIPLTHMANFGKWIHYKSKRPYATHSLH